MDITAFCNPLLHRVLLSDTERKERDIFLAGLSTEDQAVLLDVLDTIFRNLTPADDWNYRLDYLRWYTLLMWRGLGRATRMQMSDIVFPRLLGMAIMLEFDPIVELLRYIDGNPFDKDSAGLFYRTLQEKTLDSSAVIGLSKGQSVTLREVAQQLLLLNKREDSLKRTEFFTELQELFFIKNDMSTYAFIDAEEATSRLIDIMQFLLGVKPDTIWAVAKTTINADVYDAIAALNKARKEAMLSSEQDVATNELGESSLPESIDLTADYTLPAYTKIKDIIEQDAAVASSNDPMVRAEKIIEYLTNLADFYQDKNLLDLYYYNEQDQQFYWNEELLAQSR